MTPLHLRSTLKLPALARAFALRLAGEGPPRKHIGYASTNPGGSTI